jgi:hypothetical protein
MMDAKSIADKYIAPDGSKPKTGEVYVKTIIKELADQDKISMLTVVANFIAWHDVADMYGGYTADEAWKALCCILDLTDGDKFYKIVRG